MRALASSCVCLVLPSVSVSMFVSVFGLERMCVSRVFLFRFVPVLVFVLASSCVYLCNNSDMCVLSGFASSYVYLGWNHD